MATLSDLKEMKEALDAGLVSQADFDDVKRDYLRAKKDILEASKEYQKKELRAREDALEANKEFQKMELQIQKRELPAKEAFQKKKSEADLRAYALESIVKHGSSLMSEEQKVGLVRDYVKMSGLDSGAKKDFVRTKSPSKRQRIQNEKGGEASPPQPATPPALPSPADAPAPAEEDEYIIYSDDDDLAELAHGLSWLILMSRKLQREQKESSGQRRTMPLWLLLSELAKVLGQSRLLGDQTLLQRIIFTQREGTDGAAQR